VLCFHGKDKTTHRRILRQMLDCRDMSPNFRVSRLDLQFSRPWKVRLWSSGQWHHRGWRFLRKITVLITQLHIGMLHPFQHSDSSSTEVSRPVDGSQILIGLIWRYMRELWQASKCTSGERVKRTRRHRAFIVQRWAECFSGWVSLPPTCNIAVWRSSSETLRPEQKVPHINAYCILPFTRGRELYWKLMGRTVGFAWCRVSLWFRGPFDATEAGKYLWEVQRKVRIC
jgi:hypothetical protein